MSDVADDHFINQFRFNTGALDGFLNDFAPQIMLVIILQGTAHRTDGRTDTANDDNLFRIHADSFL